MEPITRRPDEGERFVRDNRTVTSRSTCLFSLAGTSPERS